VERQVNESGQVAQAPESEARPGYRCLAFGNERLIGLGERQYNRGMERKIFWLVFIGLGLLADFLLPFWWAFAATFPIIFFSWWVAYRSGWF
jgi:hypothetical protein